MNEDLDEDLEAREDELLALDSIFGPEVFVRAADGTRAPAGELRVSVELPQDFFVAVKDGKHQTHLSGVALITLDRRT